MLAMPLSLRAQDPLKTLPRNYRLVMENETVQVVHARYEAHQKLPLHDHSEHPTVYVYLTDSGPVQFSHVEAPPFALTRRPVKAGMFRVSPGRLEKHEVTNLGDLPTEFLRIEMKRVPLGAQHVVFRGIKPFDLTKSSTSNEFSNPAIQVERIIAAPRGSVRLRPTSHHSQQALLAAISRCGALEPGEVSWMPPANMTLQSTANSPAHALRLIFGC